MHDKRLKFCIWLHHFEWVWNSDIKREVDENKHEMSHSIALMAQFKKFTHAANNTTIAGEI